jgi:hypothetical protein
MFTGGTMPVAALRFHGLSLNHRRFGDFINLSSGGHARCRNRGWSASLSSRELKPATFRLRSRLSRHAPAR